MTRVVGVKGYLAPSDIETLHFNHLTILKNTEDDLLQPLKLLILPLSKLKAWASLSYGTMATVLLVLYLIM